MFMIFACIGYLCCFWLYYFSMKCLLCLVYFILVSLTHNLFNSNIALLSSLKAYFLFSCFACVVHLCFKCLCVYRMAMCSSEK